MEYEDVVMDLRSHLVLNSHFQVLYKSEEWKGKLTRASSSTYFAKSACFTSLTGNAIFVR